MHNEKLCWTRYKYIGESGSNRFLGLMQLTHQPTRDELLRRAHEMIAMTATKENEPWDPFNCCIVIAPDLSPKVGELTKDQFYKYMDDIFKKYE